MYKGILVFHTEEMEMENLADSARLDLRLESDGER